MEALGPILPLPRWRTALVAVEYEPLRDLVMRAMAREGWRVEACDHDRLAKRAITADLVVLDGIEAPSLIHTLKTSPWTQYVPAVALYPSNYAQDQEALEMAGAAAALAKPFHAEDLMSAVRAAMK